MGCGCGGKIKTLENAKVEQIKSMKTVLANKLNRCAWCSGTLRFFPNGDMRCTSCGAKKVN